MSDGITPFSWTANMAKVAQGFSDGPQWKNPILSPSMTIVDGVPPEVDEKLHSTTPSEGTIIDSWNQRRSK